MKRVAFLFDPSNDWLAENFSRRFHDSKDYDFHELYDEIRMKQAEITFELIDCFLTKYPNVNFTKQDGDPTFYRRRNPSDSQLDVDQTIRNQFNLLRICNNNDWPAFFEISGVKYKLKIEKLK